MLNRLRRKSPRELAARGLGAARVAIELAQVTMAPPAWRRERLRLAPRTGDLLHAQDALARRDWCTAEHALRTYFSSRTPRFLIDPSASRRLALGIQERLPSARADAVRRAAPLLEGRYDLLGYSGLSFATDSSAVDWHADPVHGRRAPTTFWGRVPYLDPAYGDHKIIWELNRHQHWLSLGRAAWLTDDDRYAEACVDELDSWLMANPPLVGINWSSMLELAFRSISWIWTLHFCLACDIDRRRCWLTDLLMGLDRQLDHIARHLSTYFSPNTHLLGEGLALYVAGRVLPELASAPRWEQAGRGILLKEAHAQVHPDGGHAELSPHYHRYALDFYLLALAVARRTNDDLRGALEDVATRLAVFCRALTSDHGRLPMIGDDDGGRLFPMLAREPADVRDTLWVAAVLLGRPELAVGDLPEEALWLLGGQADRSVETHSRPAESRVFRDTGYAVLRSAREHAVLDVGHHGFLNGGHAHADALSLVFFVDGRPLLIDPGTATYTMDRARRDWFRSTAMHNTAVIDGRSQSTPAGPFHWASRADASVIVWRTAGTAAAEFIEAEHDGYRPLVHRRGVLRLPDGPWLVADHVLGSGARRVVLHWHVDPAWAWHDDDARLVHPDGLYAALVSTASSPERFRGDEDGLGWYAPVYGRVEPAPTLRTSRDGSAPFSIVTAIVAADCPTALSIEPQAAVSDAPDGWHRTAALVTSGDAVWLVAFATRLPDAGHAPVDMLPLAASHERASCRIASALGDLSTDARVAAMRCSKDGDVRSLTLIDGSAAAWNGRAPFRVAVPRAGAGVLQLDARALGGG